MIDAKQLSRISVLLDELLALEASARLEFLAKLSTSDAPFRDSLQKMLVLAEAGTGTYLIDHIPCLPDYDETSADFAAGEMIDGYRLLRELGHGGMGTVWLAERADRLITRKVAIKLPIVSMPHKMLLQRFDRERSILAALSHPHIARLYDAGISESGQPYLVMEYVEGTSITVYCDTHQLTLLQRLDLFAQVLDAVQYAHANLIVHRDLKPANILVTESGQVRLLDFGIAKLLDADDVQSRASLTDASDITRLSGSPLTLDYASPEQFSSEPVNTASDIYSLSVLLYELLCGERPYKLKGLTRGQAEDLVLKQVLAAPSARITKLCTTRFNTRLKALERQLKGDLDTVVLKGLKRNPAERYATVDALAQDLQRWRNGEPVLARPDSGWYRTWRFIGRNRLAVSLSAVAALSLLIGLWVTLIQTRSAQRETIATVATEKFLIDLFKANSVDQDDPVAAQQTTARNLLDRGSQRIMVELNDSPETKLRILKTLAGLNEDLGLNDAAFQLRRKRLEIFRQLHPGSSADLATELIDLFFTANSSEVGLASAPDYLKQAEKVLDSLRDFSSPLRGRLEIGKAFLLDSDNCAAAEHSKRGVELLRQTKPSEDLSDGLLLVTVNLTFCGNPQQALLAAQEAIDIMNATGRRAKLYYAYTSISDAYTALGKVDLAIKEGRKAVAAAQKNLGPNDLPNSNLMTVAANLAKKLVGAHPREAFDLTHPLVVTGMQHLDQIDKDSLVSILIREAQASLALAQPSAALVAINQAKEVMNTFEAEDGQKTIFYDAQAEIYMAQGMLDQAGAALASASSLHIKLHHTGTVQMNRHVINQVNYQLRRKDVTQAEHELAAFFIKSPESNVVTLGKMDFILLKSEIALARHDFNEAIAKAEEIHAAVARYPLPDFARDQDAKAWVIEARARESLDQPKNAETAFKHAAAIQADMVAGVPAI